MYGILGKFAKNKNEKLLKIRNLREIENLNYSRFKKN